MTSKLYNHEIHTDVSASKLQSIMSDSENHNNNSDNEVSWSKRILALAMISIMGFGCTFCFDSPAALQTDLKNALNMTQTEFMLLYTFYSAPNIVMCVVGGFLVDVILGKRVAAISRLENIFQKNDNFFQNNPKIISKLFSFCFFHFIHFLGTFRTVSFSLRHQSRRKLCLGPISSQVRLRSWRRKSNHREISILRCMVFWKYFKFSYGYSFNSH